jgi:cytochrome b561
MHEVHEWTGRLLLALVAVHVLAVIQHAFVKKDGVWRRMWPGQ